MDTQIKLVLLSLLIGQLVAPPPVERNQAEMTDNWKYNTEGLTKEQAQDQEYFRYLTQVVGELEKDAEFKSVLNNATEDDIRSGKIAEHFDLVGHHIRQKLDEVKRLEVEYQRDLLRQKKEHMLGIDRNYWNPIHHEDQKTFSKEDLKKLLSKHNDMMIDQDKKRKDEFKSYEMQKEHELREKRKNMTEEERKKDEEEYKKHHNKKHETMHEPGHKAQLEEVWEKEDGLDPDSFDPKTFFNLHDKNGDGYLDIFELETLFLTDLDKNYNESDPDVDLKERDEELARMREHVMKSMDRDNDGLISKEEFMMETKKDDFEKDDEWKPLTEEDQYTDEEFDEYEKMLQQDGERHGDEHHEDDKEKEHPSNNNSEGH
ncbi:nucleobindin-2-like isoform X1 [Hydractinia symbiolongicarpus]|uniref:nucleobindin-2-like isoform X1 n=1 Tax=Hydractinia symbiolongicarpus TaxID=13093 RepID=UPI00254F8C67|nr:nucleobindin-2-like isoform X1 [Hydractinia symbiolongicarpus]